MRCNEVMNTDQRNNKQEYDVFRIFIYLCAALCASLTAIPARASKLTDEGAAYKRDLIKEIGLSPDRNWKRLAMEQLEKDAAQSVQN